MAAAEFECPHCSGRFALENPPAGGQVACPLCSQTLAIPAWPPRSFDESAAADEASEFVPADPPDPQTLAFAFDIGEPPSVASPVRRSRVKRREEPAADEATDKPVVVPLGREAKERRRQIRSLAWMIGGVVLLAIAAAVLSRW